MCCLLQIIGSAFDLRLRGPWFESHWSYCFLSLSKTLYLQKSTGYHPGKLTDMTEKLMEWDIKHQLKTNFPTSFSLVPVVP